VLISTALQCDISHLLELNLTNASGQLKYAGTNITMCGICGIANLRNTEAAINEDVLARMTQSMTHRGPDQDGLYCCGQVGLGSRRLSGRNSFAADEPDFPVRTTIGAARGVSLSPPTFSSGYFAAANTIIGDINRRRVL
jgi:hypothetical protein